MYSIPLIAAGQACSGFLVDRHGTSWLVSCAHIFSGLIDTPPEMSFFSGRSFTLAGTEAIIPLTQNGRQRFSVVIINPAHVLADVIAIPLTAEERPAFRRYKSFSVDEVPEARLGEQVVVYGRPNTARGDLSEIQVNAAVEQVVGTSIVISKPSRKGLSGGPVVSERGLIGSVTGDLGHVDNMRSAHIVHFHPLVANLFSRQEIE